MIEEVFKTKTDFLNLKTQFGNETITEETISIFKNKITDLNTLILKLIINLILFSLLIILSSIFISFPNDLINIHIIYVMIIFIIISIGYMFHSIYSLIKMN